MKNILAFIVLCLTYQSISSQDCIETGEFDDSPCNICAPAGWSPILAAEIDTESTLSWCPNMSESPTGETMVALDIVAGNSEGIETTFTGLTAGTTYSIGFWWFCCDWLDDADLLVEVDGVDYTFPTTYEWELVSMCVVAESGSMDVLVTAETSGNQSFVFVDDAMCSEIEPCCSITIDLESEISICPNQELILEAIIADEQGNVDIEWTSDPPEGLDYLSATDIADPIFNFANPDLPFDGTEFTFTITVEDDACQISREVEVTVLPLQEITFDFIYTPFCETDGIFTFPTESLEGISGTWNTPQVDLSNYADETIENTFTPDPGQTDCSEDFVAEIDVEELITPEFDLSITFCSSDEEYEFPLISENDIEGTWEIPILIPSDYNEDIYTNSFTSDDNFCIAEFEIEFEIIESIQTDFFLESYLCQDSEQFILPEESENNIDGIWLPPTVDPSTIVDSLVCIFTSDEEECIDDYRHVFYISENALPTFNIPDTICINAPEVILEEISLEGYLGQWDIPSFLPSDIGMEYIDLMWTPDDTENCVDPITKRIFIQELTSPEFDIPQNICIANGLYTFASVSLNGIEGIWDEPSFIPEDIVSGIFVNTFTPNDLVCYEILQIQIQIVDAILPEFDLPTILCETDDPFLFPTTTNQNTEGSWEVPFVDPADWGGGFFTNTFINNNSENCIVDTTEFDIFIQRLETPTFNIPEFICFDANTFELPTLSQNMIEGSWNIDTIVPLNYNNESIALTFTPNDAECYDMFTTSVFVLPLFDGQINTTDASNCNSDDGRININTNQIDLEFSIDDGLTWQGTLNFENLAADNYELIVRHAIFNACMTTLSFAINSPLLPVIQDSTVVANTSCQLPNGIIEVYMDSADYEFSINGGNDWQNTNAFTGLGASTHTILIRNIISPDCVISEEFTIDDVSGIMIDFIMPESPSDCGSDGSIEIFATGPDLLYSINGGSSWSASNFFVDLTAGQYDVSISSSTLTDCLDDEAVLLMNPEMAVIGDVVFSNVQLCSNQLGRIEIIANEPDIVQYSIDNGLNWSNESIFTDLNAGNYEVLIQYLGNTPNCHSVVWPIEIVEENIDILASINVSIENPSGCTNEDGQIDLGNTTGEFEYSIDGGQNWQTSSIFSGLTPNSYTIIVRSIADPSCQEMLPQQIIESIDCPCTELEFDIAKIDLICTLDNNGTISIENISGYENQINEILWEDGQIGAQLQNLNDGWHTFTIIYDVDCSYTDSVFLERINPIDFFLESFDTSCGEENNGGVEIIDVTGGSGAYSYSLDGSSQDVSSFYNLSPGEFEALVTDTLGCLKSEFISVLEGEYINIDLPEVMALELGQSAFLNPLINESTIDSFVWSSNQEFISNDVLVIEVLPEETTEYTLTIYYGNCIEVRTILINVNKEKLLYLGNVFSPNGDGKNDIFFIQSSETNSIEIQSFKIYDRWGNLVFAKLNPSINVSSDGWNGTINNANAIGGVYIFLIEYTTNQNIKIETGSITLLR